MAGDLICRCRKRLAQGFSVEADFTIPLDRAPVTVLFGPSGAGKTTLLRLLAGLERPDAGEIVFRGRAWFDSATGVCLEPGQRRAGFVFQDYALFPHLTVAQNVKFGAGNRPSDGVLRQFGLADLAGRLPRQLSGGEQQRLALARAMAASPELLLLDEPLSALDLNSRVKLRHELRRMLLDAAVPSIVVTHDRTEAMVLGEARFHTCLEAEAWGIGLLLPGHFASERFAVEDLAGLLGRQFPEVQVWASRQERDPLEWIATSHCG